IEILCQRSRRRLAGGPLCAVGRTVRAMDVAVDSFCARAGTTRLSAYLYPRRSTTVTTTLGSRFAVVVAAHRSYATLSLCLKGFRTIVRNPADLIFVDNGSGGALTYWVNQQFPDVTVLQLNDNRLFCGGYNTGIRHALDRDYEYVLIVN